MIPTNAMRLGKREQNRSLIDRAIVRRSAQVSDGAGGSTEVVTYIPDVPCRVVVATLMRSEQLVASQLQNQIPSIITFELGTDIRPEDRINVNGTLVDITIAGGTLYEVIGEFEPGTYNSANAYLCMKRG